MRDMSFVESFVENYYFFGSSFPAKRIPNVNVTSTESTNAMNPVASLATGKYPFLRADWTMKYLVTPVKTYWEMLRFPTSTTLIRRMRTNEEN